MRVLTEDLQQAAYTRTLDDYTTAAYTTEQRLQILQLLGVLTDELDALAIHLINNYQENRKQHLQLVALLGVLCGQDAISLNYEARNRVFAFLVNKLQNGDPKLGANGSNVLRRQCLLALALSHNLSPEAIEEIRQTLFPLTTLITPNLNEVSTLTGRQPRSPEEMAQEASRLAGQYGTSVLIKGGHLEGDTMYDVLHTLDGQTYTYEEKKIESPNLHGTGCTLSSAIATHLAHGLPMDEAVRRSKAYISLAIAAGRGLGIGHGNGPLWHFVG